MKRRDFLVRSAYGLGAVWLSSHPFVSNLISQTLPRRFAASDTVTLGKTGEFLRRRDFFLVTGVRGFYDEALQWNCPLHSHQESPALHGLPA